MSAAREGERRRAARHTWLTSCIALSVALIVAVGVWDENREAAAALRDLEQGQSALASLIAAGVAAQLEVVRLDALAEIAEHAGEARPTGSPRRYESLRVAASDAAPPDAPVDLVRVSMPAGAGLRADALVRASQLLVGIEPGSGADLALLWPPGDASFHSSHGERFESAPLRDSLARGRRIARLSRAQAAALGLPERVAIAGTAWVRAGALGRWGVAVVTSAGPERDRQARARWRLIFGVVLAGGLVLAFGGYALRAQRKELELVRELTVAELGQQRDEQLEREGRAATMLTLAAGVAHEISTPLGVILGRAEQLRERAVDARDAAATQRILEQAARIEGVVRGFLKLARGDAPTLERLDPAEVVRGTAALVEHRFAKAGVRLVIEPGSPLRPVRGDRRLLEHALVNLLLNACDACERGGEVRLVAHHDPDGGAAVFEVLDDGEGISPDRVARATEPFFSTKPAGQGTGLGLAIASEIVKIHRGTLEIGPRHPKGTRAAVRVPTEQGADDGSP